MDKATRIVLVVVGVIVAILSYQFWFGSGIFNGYFVPPPPDGFESLGGALGAGNPDALKSAGKADFFSQLAEIGATILTTIGTVLLFIVTKGSRLLASVGMDIWQGLKPNKEEDTPTRAIAVAGMSDEQWADYMRVLEQAVSDGNPGLTIQMCHELFGSPYLHETLMGVVDEHGFPESEGGE